MLGLKVAKKMPKCVECIWEDGLHAKFSYLWLRDNTPKRPSLVHLELDSRPEAVNYSRESLQILWPPFMASKYSSDFLRQNALCPVTDTSDKAKDASEFDSSSGFLRAGTWTLVRAAPVDPTSVMGTCEWTTSSREPGTIWPHMHPVPSLCAVDVLSGSAAQVTIVDSTKALARLAEQNVAQFEFLTRCKLPYREGPFGAKHSICGVQNGIIVPGVFNNTSRSSAIPVESAEELYECLQTYGRICADLAQTVQIQPGQRLLVDNSRAMLGAPAQAGRHLLLRILS